MMTDRKYVTEDSGSRTEFPSGMVREDAGKIRFDLITPSGVPYEEQMLTRWAVRMTQGAGKYAPKNWELAETQEELDRFRESAFRHFMQWFLGADDGEDHAAATFFNIAGAETVRWKLGE